VFFHLNEQLSARTCLIHKCTTTHSVKVYLKVFLSALLATVLNLTHIIVIIVSMNSAAVHTLLQDIM
jgi:hypothetical protein